MLQQKLMTTNDLSSWDGTNQIDIMYHVTTMPLYGHVELINNPDLTVGKFTQMDLLAGKVKTFCVYTDLYIYIYMYNSLKRVFIKHNLSNIN